MKLEEISHERDSLKRQLDTAVSDSRRAVDAEVDKATVRVSYVCETIQYSLHTVTIKCSERHTDVGDNLITRNIYYTATGTF